MALVLIVDDDPMIVNMLVDMVHDQGHTTSTAFNGAEALAQARTQRPALIISDVMMPVMDGYALLQAVRAAPDLQQTAIVLMSAVREAPRALPADAAPDHFMTKPFNLSVIDELLDRLIRAEGEA
jgi:CheY-like chemotaxis protein